MAGFIDEILSGKYPRIENLWNKEFGKVMDELLGEKREPAASDDLERIKAVLTEEQSRHEVTKRQLAVAKAECEALQCKLDAVKQAVDK